MAILAFKFAILGMLGPTITKKKIVLKVGFMVFKRSGFESRFQRKRRKLNRTIQSRDISKKAVKFDGLVWIAKFDSFFAYFSGLGGPI